MEPAAHTMEGTPSASLPNRARFFESCRLAMVPAQICLLSASITADFNVFRWCTFALAIASAGWVYVKYGRGQPGAIPMTALLLVFACSGLGLSFYLQGEHEERAARQAAAAQTANVR